MTRLEEDDRAVFEAIEDRPLHFSIVRFRNHGGIPMPLPLEIRYADGTVERGPAPSTGGSSPRRPRWNTSKANSPRHDETVETIDR